MMKHQVFYVFLIHGV